jgi:glucose/arabinose dehydrogenase
MFIDPESKALFIVTKEPRGGRLYSVALDVLKDRVQSELKFVGRVNADSVSGGAISPDGRRIVLRREEHGWLWNRRPGASVAEALQGAPQVVTVRGRRQGKNGEAVAFRGDSKRYLTLSEGKKQAISEFDVPVVEASNAGNGSN